MTRRGIFVNRDGSTEAWDGDNYVALGSMRASEPAREDRRAFPPPPQLYMVVEEYPAVTIGEFRRIAEDQRRQAARRRKFNKLLRLAVKLASSKREGDQ